MKLFFTGSLALVCAFSSTFNIAQGKLWAALLYAIAAIFLWNMLWNKPEN
jgi:hypothetical protein